MYVCMYVCSCVLLILVGIGNIYACIAVMIITDEATAKSFKIFYSGEADDMHLRSKSISPIRKIM